MPYAALHQDRYGERFALENGFTKRLFRACSQADRAVSFSVSKCPLQSNRTTADAIKSSALARPCGAAAQLDAKRKTVKRSSAAGITPSRHRGRVARQRRPYAGRRRCAEMQD